MDVNLSNPQIKELEAIFPQSSGATTNYTNQHSTIKVGENKQTLHKTGKCDDSFNETTLNTIKGVARLNVS